MGESGKPVSYQPTAGLSYDPTDAVYWDPDALAQEVGRVFEVCHGCRLCFKYCDSFPSLFRFVDDRHDGEVAKLTEDEVHDVFSQCFQCKLCEVQCPYTPSEGHEFQLDFPKLVHRYQAQRRKREKPKLGRRILANPDRAASMARGSLGLANVMNRVKLHRWFMEKTLGIHRKKWLPDFAGTTFEKWARKQGLVQDEAGGEAVLFQTCFVNNNEPEIGRDTVDVLQRNDVDVRCAKGFRCCGMPSWELGDLDAVRQAAAHNLQHLMPFVDAGAKVIALNPTCSMMMRREYPTLLEGEDRSRAEKLAEAVQDPSEFLWAMRKEERFNEDFRSTPDMPVAYHAPCHLRAQRAGFRGRDLLRKIPGVTPKVTMECCGHDGTYAMTVEGFEPSQRIGAKAFEGMQEADTEVWATDCPHAALQFAQHAGRKPMHPMSILARAYRADGFGTAVPTPDDPNPGEGEAAG